MTDVKFNLLADAGDAVKEFKNLAKAGEAAEDSLEGLDKIDFPDPPEELLKGIRDVQQASSALLKARGREADAAGLVRVAELKLQEARSSGKEGSQLAASEEKVASALRKSEEAAKQTANAMDELERAQRNAAKLKDIAVNVDINADSQSALKEIDKVDKAGQNIKDPTVKVKVDDDSFQELGSELREAGASGASAFSGAFLGGLAGGDLVGGIVDQITEGLDAFAERKNFLADIQNNMGISTDQARQYGDRIGTAYAGGLGDSKDQIAEAYSLLSSDVKDWANLNADQQDKIARGAVKIAQAFKVDVSDELKAASALVTNKLSPSFQDAFDLITKGFQTLGSRGDDAIETLNEYAGYFHQLGITGPQALGLLQQGLQAGARDTDYVADIWKEVGIRIIDTAQSTKDALKDLFKGTKTNVADLQKTIAAGGPAAEAALEKVVTKLQGIKDPIEKNRLGVALFGTQYEDTFRRVIEQTDLAKAKLTDYQGATDNLVGHTRTLTDQIGQFWDNFNVKVGSAIDFANSKAGELFTTDSLIDGSLDGFKAKADESSAAAYTFGISLDGTNRGIATLAESVGGPGTKAFSDLIQKMTDSQLAALGVTVSLDGVGNRVLTLPDGHKITINTNSGEVSGDLDALKRKTDSLPTSKFFTYFIDTVVRGPGPGSLNSLNAVLGGGHAAGGWVTGPGTSTSDSILTPTSDGEFVVKADAAQANAPALEALNAGKKLNVSRGAMRSLGGYGADSQRVVVNVDLDNRIHLDGREMKQFSVSSVQEHVSKVGGGDAQKALGGRAR